MTGIGLLRVAVEAELIRVNALIKRQVRRGLWGAIAGIFALSVLALGDVLAWQIIRLYFEAIPTTAILLGVNLVCMLIFLLPAGRSRPGRAEREALQVREDAFKGARSSLMVTGVVMAGQGYLDRRRRRKGA